jgi:hypothetical protein
MNLIYINELGLDYKNQRQYEFIFSKSEFIEVDEWYTIPASVSPEPKTPDIKYIDFVGILKNTNIKLELIQNSDYFGVIDAVDGVISLAWEKFDSENNEERLTFKFGEPLENVKKKLSKRDYFLINEEIKFKIS